MSPLLEDMTVGSFSETLLEGAEDRAAEAGNDGKPLQMQTDGCTVSSRCPPPSTPPCYTDGA
jgi:hypothetical protein